MASKWDSYQLPRIKRSTPERQQRDEQFASLLRGFGAVAPIAGTAIGAIGGGIVGGPVGAGAGAGIGGAIGSGLSGLAGYGADEVMDPHTKRDMEREARLRALAML